MGERGERAIQKGTPNQEVIQPSRNMIWAKPPVCLGEISFVGFNVD